MKIKDTDHGGRSSEADVVIRLAPQLRLVPPLPSAATIKQPQIPHDMRPLLTIVKTTAHDE